MVLAHWSVIDQKKSRIAHTVYISTRWGGGGLLDANLRFRDWTSTYLCLVTSSSFKATPPQPRLHTSRMFF